MVDKKNGPRLLALSLQRSSYDDLVFLVFPSSFFPPSYNMSLLKNGFVTLFLIQFSYNFQKITLISLRIRRRKICALSLEFSYPKKVKKKPRAQLQTTKIAKFSARSNYFQIKLRLHVFLEIKPFIINSV